MTTVSAQLPREADAGFRLVLHRLLLFAPVAFLGNAVGPLLRYPDVGTAVLFPPYAIVTAALLVSRRQDWIWYIGVDAVAHLILHWPQWSLSWVVAASVANVARALVATVLIGRLCGGPPRLTGVPVLLLFLFSAVLVAPAVGATLGAVNVVLHGGSTSFREAWIAWFVSNALTGLTLMPAVSAGFAWLISPRRPTRARVIEAGLLGLVLVATCAVAFLSVQGRRHLALPLYGPMAVLIWAALRFGDAGASATLSAVTFAAIVSVDRGTGPFAEGTPDNHLLALQVFVLFMSLPMLCLAAVATGRQTVGRLHTALLASLQHHVAILDARGIVLEVSESWRQFADAAGVRAFHRARPGDDYVMVCRSAEAAGDTAAAGVGDGIARVLTRARQRFELEYDYGDTPDREVYIMTVEALARDAGGAVVTRGRRHDAPPRTDGARGAAAADVASRTGRRPRSALRCLRTRAESTAHRHPQ